MAPEFKRTEGSREKMNVMEWNTTLQLNGDGTYTERNVSKINVKRKETKSICNFLKGLFLTGKPPYNN